MKIANTYNKKQKSRKRTWKSPNGSTKNKIDHMLTNKNIIQNVDAFERLDVGSDHRLVRGTIKLNSELGRSR